jgi:hypothetical protein
MSPSHCKNIMFAVSVAFLCLPTCFFLDAIKEIHDKNISLSIYPKKRPGKRGTFSMVEMAVSCSTR